jgi:hypothetical protein
MRRSYYFQPDAQGDGIIWYVGTSDSYVQGPYYAWRGSIDMGCYSWLAAASYKIDGSNSFYIVGGGLQGGGPGLSVLYRGFIPNDPYMFSFTGSSPITPGGVDARWPIIYMDRGSGITVIYTVASNGSTGFYSIPIYGGTPTLLYTTDSSVDPRPSGVVDTDDGSVLLIQEFATGAVRAFYLGSESEAIETNIPARFGRYSVYLDASYGWRYLYEESGSLINGYFDIASVPRKPLPSAEPDIGVTEPDSADDGVIDGAAGSNDDDVAAPSDNAEDMVTQ